LSGDPYGDVFPDHPCGKERILFLYLLPFKKIFVPVPRAEQLDAKKFIETVPPFMGGFFIDAHQFILPFRRKQAPGFRGYAQLIIFMHH
jgi:hypothetical protein